MKSRKDCVLLVYAIYKLGQLLNVNYFFWKCCLICQYSIKHDVRCVILYWCLHHSLLTWVVNKYFKTFKTSYPWAGDVKLPMGKAWLAEVHTNPVERLTLGLIDGHSKSQLEGELHTCHRPWETAITCFSCCSRNECGSSCSSST